MQRSFLLALPLIVGLVSIGLPILVLVLSFVIRKYTKEQEKCLGRLSSVWHQQSFLIRNLEWIGYLLIVLLSVLGYSLSVLFQILPFFMGVIGVIFSLGGIYFTMAGNFLISDLRDRLRDHREGRQSAWHRKPKTLKLIASAFLSFSILLILDFMMFITTQAIPNFFRSYLGFFFVIPTLFISLSIAISIYAYFIEHYHQ